VTPDLPWNDRFGADYYRENGQAGDRPALRWYARLVRRYCGPGPYLDYGCGTGHLLRRLTAQGAASGLEVSAWSVAAARTTAPGATVYSHPDDLPAAAFGVLVAVHVLEHLDDDAVAAALRTWRRVLVPRGRALVATPDPAGRGHAIAGRRWVGYADPTHVNLKPHAQWRELLIAHGFAVLREASDGLWNVPYGRVLGPRDVARAAPAFAQYVAGRLVLPPGSGESSVFVVERSGKV
jgi:SAM-dependent methyltransferase